MVLLVCHDMSAHNDTAVSLALPSLSHTPPADQHNS
jgi:hypothetical protein